MNLNEAAQQAVDIGAISKGASAPADAAVAAAAGESTGVNVSELSSGKAFLTNVIIDDSRSVKGFEPPIVAAYNFMLEQMKEAGSRQDVLVQVTLLNQGQILPYTPLEEVRPLVVSEFRADGGTPLFGTIQRVVGTMLTKYRELHESGRTAQSVTVIITDGEATDDSLQDEVTDLVTGLREVKQHLLIGVAIGANDGDAEGEELSKSSAYRTFKKLGFAEDFIVAPARNAQAFQRAMRRVSRASAAASKGAGAFQSIVDSGVGGSGAFR